MLPRLHLKTAAAFGALATLLSGCGEDAPGTGPAPTIPAPVHVSPPSGSFVEAQPNLTIRTVAASGGSTPTYHFQVSLNDAYSPIAAQESGIPQGASGETSWRVNVPLPSRDVFLARPGRGRLDERTVLGKRSIHHHGWNRRSWNASHSGPPHERNLCRDRPRR